ncbi:MAG: glycoside hydrolase family 99-like domain-containing protein [Isosphaeraceae bacterium]
MTKTARWCAVLLGWLLLNSGSPGIADEQSRVLAEWAFDRAGDLLHWSPGGQLVDVKVAGGVLHCRAAGSDPILELSSLLDLTASPWQAVEIRLRADRDGMAELFWSNTNQGRYGGFGQDKTTRFQVVGDNQWHTYRLFPFWQAERKIVRLRFDVYDGVTFDLDSFRIVELPMPAPATSATFDFAGSNRGWQALGGAVLQAGSRGASITAAPVDSFVLGPPVNVQAEDQSYVSLRMSVTRGDHATLFFATDRSHGLHSISFSIEPGPQPRTYNVDLLSARDWKGKVVALGLRPSDDPTARAVLQRLEVSDAPRGPARLQLVSFGVADALPRVGVPTTLEAVVTNSGGETATGIRASLSLPDGVRLDKASPADSRLERLGFGEEAILRWKVRADRPISGEAGLVLSARNGAGSGPPDVRGHARLSITPRLLLPATGYVPEPKPVRGPYEVGVYYFPGWKTASQWSPISRFPERRPVLGWYREGSPELADWQIKWAVEHGITYFAYDWYWSQGSRQLEHALHDGYFQARYRRLLKFCLLWANHNAAGTSSLEDCLAVTRYWITNYFRRPEYLTVEGKPVVIIFSLHRLSADLGAGGVKQAFEAMRDLCRKEGLKGLHLIACVGDSGGAREAAREGYDAVTAYNWPGLAMAGTGLKAPFATLLEGYRRHWTDLVEQSPIPLSPLPLSGGWDSRPWHGENNLIRFGRTPALFKQHLKDARKFLEARSGTANGRKSVLIEAWNEWGEGSYIEPHREFGFGYLDAIRDVFTSGGAHQDVTPADVNLGPYDVAEPPPSRISWDFAAGSQGWTAMMGMSEARVADGGLQALTESRDPAFTSPPLQARAGEFRAITIRLKLEPTHGGPFQDTAQLFWQSRQLSESEASSLHFKVRGDGQWHEYRVPVADNRRWRGVITRLRFDPCNRPDVRVSIGAVRLVH